MNSGLKTRLDSSRILSLHHLVGLLVRDAAPKPMRGLALDQLRADVRGHDDDRVAEIDLAAEGVGHLALLQNLQEQVHHVRVRLFDFVEEHDGVGPAADGFGKLAALLVTDVARRRTDQARGGELLHVLGHVDLDERVASPNMNSASVWARKVLPTPVGPRKMNEPIGRRGSLRSARERRSALQMAMTASSWPMTLPLQFALPSRAASGSSACSMRLSGTPVHFETTCMMSSSVTKTSFSSRLFAPFGQDALQLVLGLLFLVAQGGGLFEILGLDRGFLAAADFLDLVLDLLHVGRAGHRADARARAGFVHHVDRLVGQETAGEIAVARAWPRLRALRRSTSALWCASYFGRRPLRIRMVSSTLGASTFTSGSGVRGRHPSRCICDIR